jgi:hypothetical protein
MAHKSWYGESFSSDMPYIEGIVAGLSVYELEATRGH